MNELEKIGFKYCPVPTGQLYSRINSKGKEECIFIEDGKIHFYNDSDPQQHIYSKKELMAIVKYMGWIVDLYGGTKCLIPLSIS